MRRDLAGRLLCALLPAWPLAAAPVIHWHADRVEVTGLTEPALPAADALAVRFTVRTGGADAPAMLGKWSVERGTVRFAPRFPLSPGLTYTATWQPAEGKAITSRHTVPRPAAPGTVVAHIFPGSDTVPENLLKFYLHFSAPMSGGDVYKHLHLRNAAGQEVELPFLELAEELWNPEMTRLTLFIDPGRVKREVKPLEDIGPALVAGQAFTLAVDAAWRDAAGQPLKQAAEKKFRVTAPDRTPPDAKAWQLTAPAAATRDALRLTFPEPLDHALALRVITVRGVTGQSALSDDGTRWTFTPAAAWSAGPHALIIQPELEDLAGNSIAKPFEVDIAGAEKDRTAAKAVELPFTVQ